MAILSVHAHESYLNFFRGSVSQVANAYAEIAQDLQSKGCSNANQAKALANKWSKTSSNIATLYNQVHEGLMHANQTHHGGSVRLRKTLPSQVHDELRRLLAGQDNLARSICDAMDPDVHPLQDSLNLTLQEYLDAYTTDNAGGMEVTAASRYPAPIYDHSHISAGFGPGVVSSGLVGTAGYGHAGTDPPYQLALNDPKQFTGGQGASAFTKGTALVSFGSGKCGGFKPIHGYGAAWSDPFELGAPWPQHSWSTESPPKKEWHNANPLGHDLGGCDDRGPPYCAVVGSFPHFVFNTNPDDLWNQPRVIVALRKQTTNQKKVWDFNFHGRIPTNVSLRTVHTRGDQAAHFRTVAIAGAMAYYHRPGDWREPPSAWNPFWRAKLHPLRERDVRDALANGQPAASRLANHVNY